MAQQIKKKFMAANSIDESKILLSHDAPLRGLNSSAAEVDLLKINSTNQLELMQVPVYYNGVSSFNIGYIDDASTAVDSVWSSDKINTTIAALTGADIGFDPSGLTQTSATDVQQAIADLDSAIDTLSALDISFDPTGLSNIVGTDVQTALADLDGAIDAIDVSSVINDAVTATDSTWSSTKISTELGNYILATEKGANNGVATLDAGGKVPVAQLPSSVMEYKGTWDASLNSPVLADGVGDQGDIYVTSVGGTQDLGSGNITFAAGDWVMYNGSSWEKSTNSNAVASVNGQTGVVVLDTDDVSEGATNKYYSSTLFDADLALKTTDDLAEGATNKYYASALFDADLATKDATDLAFTSTGTLTSINVGAALDELEALVLGLAATDISFDATGLTQTSATTVQVAIADLDGAIDALDTAVSSNSSSISSLSSDVDGKWDVSGNALTADAVLGSTSDFDISIQRNGSEFMKLTDVAGYDELLLPTYIRPQAIVPFGSHAFLSAKGLASNKTFFVESDQDDHTGSTAAIMVRSGLIVNAGDFSSGAATFKSGRIQTGNGNSGVVDLESGYAGGTGNSGQVNIHSGYSIGGDSGAVSIFTGSGVNTGGITLTTGTATGTRGSISLLASGITMGAEVDMSTNKIVNVVDPTAAQDAATKAYVDAQIGGSSEVYKKVKITLSAGDITNQYVDLGFEASVDSVKAFVGRLAIHEDSAAGANGDDYTLSYTGGASSDTRLTFQNSIATGGDEALVAGDVLFIYFTQA